MLQLVLGMGTACVGGGSRFKRKEGLPQVPSRVWSLKAAVWLVSVQI